jgi:predicted site-specific integrase-resolvase
MRQAVDATSPTELLTAEELGTALKLSPHTVKEWARRGIIPSVWLGQTCRRFVLADVMESLHQAATQK